VASFGREDVSLPPLFSVGETIVVSSDAELALSQGVVLSANSSCLRVALDRDLHDKAGWHERRYHVDRYEYRGSSSSSLVNLVKLMADNDAMARLRSLIVNK